MLQVDHSFKVGRQPGQKMVRHLLVAHAGDERARVDERVRRRAHLADGLQERCDAPQAVQLVSGDDGGIGQRLQHPRVVALLVDALAQLQRQQRRRRAGEADAPIRQSGDQAIRQLSGNQAIRQSGNQAIRHQSVNQPIRRCADAPISQSANQPISRSADQPVSPFGSTHLEKIMCPPRSCPLAESLLAWCAVLSGSTIECR